MGNIPESSRVPTDKRIDVRTPLYKGMQSDDVEKMQSILNTLNEEYSFDNINTEVIPSGYFGTKTQRMLMSFQSFWNYEPTGQFDEATLDLMEWKYYNYMDNYQKKQARLLAEAEAKKAKNQPKKQPAKDPFSTRKW